MVFGFGFLCINRPASFLLICVFFRFETYRNLLLPFRGRGVLELRFGSHVRAIAPDSFLARAFRLACRVILSYPFICEYYVVDSASNDGINGRFLIVGLIWERAMSHFVVVFVAFCMNGSPTICFRLRVPRVFLFLFFLVAILGVRANCVSLECSMYSRSRDGGKGSYNQGRVKPRRSFGARSNKRRNGSFQIFYRLKDGRSGDSGSGRKTRRVKRMKSRIRMVVGCGHFRQDFIVSRPICVFIRVGCCYGKSGRYGDRGMNSRGLLGSVCIRSFRPFVRFRPASVQLPPFFVL